MKKQKRQLKISLNGTSENPFNRFGLTRNPFPQIAKYEYMAGQDRLAKLGADPIPHDNYEAHIRETLGLAVSDEVVQLCVQKFKPGEMTEFSIYWEE